MILPAWVQDCTHTTHTSGQTICLKLFKLFTKCFPATNILFTATTAAGGVTQSRVEGVSTPGVVSPHGRLGGLSARISLCHLVGVKHTPADILPTCRTSHTALWPNSRQRAQDSIVYRSKENSHKGRENIFDISVSRFLPLSNNLLRVHQKQAHHYFK